MFETMSSMEDVRKEEFPALKGGCSERENRVRTYSTETAARAVEVNKKNPDFYSNQPSSPRKYNIYLDHAGTTLASKRQLDGFHGDMLSNLYGNPHSHSPSSQLTTDTIDQIRYRILRYLNTFPEDYSVVFTSGCTASLKLVAELFDFQGNDCYHGDKSDLIGNCQITVNKCNQMRDKSTLISDSDCSQEIHQKAYCENCFRGDCNHQVNNERSYKEKKCQSAPVYDGCKEYRSGSFTYLIDNHTSVQGIRQLALSRAGQVACIGCSCQGNNLDKNVKVVYKHENFCHSGNHLFAYPAQSNYSGWKYPLEWIQLIQEQRLPWQGSIEGQVEGHHHRNNRWCVLLDAAALVSTSPLDLGAMKPDFVTLSFYKMFGFPTGLGALLVRNDASDLLKKSYFGGGTVNVSLPSKLFHVPRSSLCERLEDGTISFLDIVSLRHGFDALEHLAGGIKSISDHTYSLAKYFYDNLTSCCHGNGATLAEVYTYGDFQDPSRQGAIVNFNLIRANGEYIGFATVDSLAQLHNIHVRTGCFCNIGACQYFLHMSDEQIQENFAAGHVCGDNNDLIDGKPTGSVRVSFGYMSTLQDAQACLQFIVDCFLENTNKPVFKSVNTLNQSTVNPERSHVTASGLKLTETKVITEKYTKVKHADRDVVEDISELIVKEETVSDITAEEFASCSGKHLSDICLFPIKSCGAFKVPRWHLGDRGLLYDREWMVVTESGIAMSQKREPMLCLVQPTIDTHKHVLRIEFPGMASIEVPLHQDESTDSEVKLCNSRVCGDRYTFKSRASAKLWVQSIECGDAVGAWLSEALQRPGCRLIRQKSDDKRISHTKQGKHRENQSVDGGQLSLANVSQFLLVSKDSVVDLQTRMLEGNQAEGEYDENNLVDRFRGNLVISGCEAFEEDSWQSVQIGNIKFTSQGPCTRCQMICMDQSTGQKSNEPLRTLQKWKERKTTFGIHLCVDSDWLRPDMVLQVGDPVFPDV